MTNVKTSEAITAAKTLIEYCKLNADLCNSCPFHTKDIGELTDCLFGYDIPEDWEIEEYEEGRY